MALKMNDSTVSSILTKAAEDKSVMLSRSAISVFDAYYNRLIKYGDFVNLTAIKKEEDVARLHFLDSLALLSFAGFKNKKVLDVGSGAGFPGIPLKIAEPTIDLTLLDATKKRVDFLDETCRELNINALCVHARAEDAALITSELNMREQFDIVVSRAVARLCVLCELCLPFLRVGGVFPAMKGIDSDDEVSEAHNAIKVLGAEVKCIAPYTIPGTNISHRVITIQKISQTPENFPRRFARIEKKPL